MTSWTEAELPPGAAYRGATVEALKRRRDAEGDKYFPSVFNPGTLSRRGPIRVAEDRIPANKSQDGRPGFNMYYELHGEGPIHLVFLMGLNNSCFGWLDQVDEFGHDPRYSVLVLDNRGYGNTDAPHTRYTTSAFAEDVADVFQHLGWTEPRSVHLVGVSMGGMIALEMCRRYSERFASATLLSTTAGDAHNLPPIKGLGMIVLSVSEQIVGAGSPLNRIKRVLDVLFPQEWLDAKSPTDPHGRTNRELVLPVFLWRFNFARRPTLHGALSQMAASLTHHVPAEELGRIDKTVPRIQVITGNGA